MRLVLGLFYVFAFVVILTSCGDNQFAIDANGYIMFCPCMGRFGNQADQFLGAMAFAHELNRTLVLPHWVEYPQMHSTSIQVPFDRYFQVEPLRVYTRVILMNDFMDHIAPTVWPIGERTVLCYGPRSQQVKSCNAKDGNPFGPYWTNFNIDFDHDSFYGPLAYDPREDLKRDWDEKYPASSYPVLAFTGAPGSFPVLQQNVELHKYLKWSGDVEADAMKLLMKINKKNEFLIGIHLRNGVDFKRACEHIKDNERFHFFASAQCLGYRFEYGRLSRKLCLQSEIEVTTQLRKAIEKYEAKYVYIASDDNFMMARFNKEFPNVSFFKYEGNNPHVDLCILGKSFDSYMNPKEVSLVKAGIYSYKGKANHAILNCVSTFSAFVKRERDATNKTTEFWSFKPDRHDEL